MRADRVIRALLLLQSRGSMTAAELADELEVSVATARRDFGALLAAGFPLYSQPGRGGGWRILGGSRLDLTALTGPEAAALFLRLGRSPNSDTDASAEQKLLQALPAPTREKAERIRDATKTGPAWGERPTVEPAEALTLRQAIPEQRVVRFEYGSRRGEREVIPLVVGNRGDRWYLIAAGTATDEAGGPAQPRTYRIDRIRNLTKTMRSGSPPEDFDANRTWERFGRDVQQLRAAVTATVDVRAEYVPVFLHHFGTHARALTDTPDSTLVEVSAHSAQGLAEQLAGWALVSTVTAPRDVREALAAIGTALTTEYATSHEDTR